MTSTRTDPRFSVLGFRLVLPNCSRGRENATKNNGRVVGDLLPAGRRVRRRACRRRRGRAGANTFAAGLLIGRAHGVRDVGFGCPFLAPTCGFTAADADATVDDAGPELPHAGVRHQ
ncbi:hypothetical protein ACWEGE_34105 [Amycolatopsis sp. NPDC004747]